MVRFRPRAGPDGGGGAEAHITRTAGVPVLERGAWQSAAVPVAVGQAVVSAYAHYGLGRGRYVQGSMHGSLYFVMPHTHGGT